MLLIPLQALVGGAHQDLEKIRVCGPMGCKMIDGPPEAPEYETQCGPPNYDQKCWEPSEWLPSE